MRSLVVALLLVGCGAHHRYAAGRVAPIDEDLRWPTVVAQVIDAREGGHAVRSPSLAERRAIDELREAALAHAAALGLISPDARAVAAPASAKHIDAILRRATEAGAREVVFLREHQARVYLGSALALFEIVVVDPRTREILFQRASLGCRREAASPFDTGESALHDALRRTIGDLFSALLRSRAAGHPARHADSLADRLLARPLARIDGDHVTGPGWSFQRPPGWEVAGDLASASGGVRAEDGTFASIVLEPTPRNARDYAFGSVSVLREVADVLVVREVGVEDRSTVEVETRYANGVRALQRITAIGGIGIVVTCAAPTADLLERHRGECERVLDSTHLTLGPSPVSRRAPAARSRAGVVTRARIAIAAREPSAP